MVLDTCSHGTRSGVILQTKSDCSGESEILTLHGGEYRLCWCAAGYKCSDASDFVVDVGIFTVAGIENLESGHTCMGRSDRTCISGQPCNVDGIQGLHLTDMDKVAILDTCGVPASNVASNMPHMLGHLKHFTLPVELAQSMQSMHSVRSVTWSTDYLTVPGGFYKLCWCAGSFSCSLSEHFQIEAGDLTVLGPSPTQQHRTCTSGQNCILEGISVTNPTLTDAVIVLQSCGTAGPMLQSTSSLSHVVANLGTSGRVDFGESFATASGGIYRLCWCSGEFSCRLPTDFRVQFGELVLIGMSPLFQDRTCISGETCVIHGLQGQSLDDSLLMVLESCGSKDLVPRLASATGVSVKGGDLTGGDLTDIASRALFETVSTAAGGRYRLCWCAEFVNTSSRCQSPRDFRQDVGTLTLLGAAPLDQDFTCQVGNTCPLRSISGEGLAADDSVMLLNTCGTGDLPQRFPAPSDANSNSSTSSMTSKTLRYMTGPYFNIIWQTVTASGGIYRLCWCSSTSVCSTAEDFRLDFGTLTLAGPSPLLQLYTCTSGQVCNLPRISVHDTDVGEVSVLSTCSFQSALAPPGFPNHGLLTSVTSVTAQTDKNYCQWRLLHSLLECCKGCQ